MKKNDPPKLFTTVSVALRLGVYPSKSMVERDLLGFLAATDRGDWTVGGRFPSIEDGLAKHVRAPLRSVEWALASLRKAGVIEVTKKGYATTYSLSPGFRQRCVQVYEAYDWKSPDWGLLEDVLSQQLSQPWTATHCGPRPQPIAVASRDTEERTPNGVLSSKERRTAEAARGLRPHEGEPMSDHPTDDGFYPNPKQRRREYEAPALGADPTQRLGETKVVRGATPTSAVSKTRKRFVAQFTQLSEQHKIPVIGSRAKMHANIKLMLDDGYSDDIIDRAWEYFAGMVPSMYLGGTTLWDLFFAKRDEALQFAHVASIGSHGGPRESLMDRGRRLSTHQQKDT